MMADSSTTNEQQAASACPVDHKTRAAWLSQYQDQQQQDQQQQQHSHQSTKTSPELRNSSPLSSSSPTTPKACSSSTIDQALPCPSSSTTSASTTTATTTKTPLLLKNARPLSHDREISSIPRSIPTPISTAYSSSSPPPSSSSSSDPKSPHTPTPTPTPTSPGNAASTSTSTSTSTHWIYPSERQFFDAMRRKNYNPSPNDMATIIPLHNAVNERAWSRILDWERGWSGVDSSPCGGPKLFSFRGLGGGDDADWWAVSPRARWNSLWGYRRPFDRHDWVVERCGGRRVEYVIDFYEGRADQTSRALGKMSFYLDVRPKLNSWEGWRMRVMRFFFGGS